jgi:nitrogen-specific signal transduction histidine kinase
MEADLALQHDHARRNHRVYQQIAGLRGAAQLLEANLPNGQIQGEMFLKIALQCRKDAVTLEEKYL